MRVVGRDHVEKCMKKHADSRNALRAWLAEAEEATWRSPHDVRDRYPSVDFVRKGLAVFDIKGNDYRLVAQIAFSTGVVIVQKVGTHAEYDTWTL